VDSAAEMAIEVAVAEEAISVADSAVAQAAAGPAAIGDKRQLIRESKWN